MEPINLEQKVETRFCMWDKRTAKLWWFDALWGGYSDPGNLFYTLAEYGSAKKFKFLTIAENLVILPYSDNYVVEGGILYEKLGKPTIL